ncbi:MAG: patatin-like phospholipase family protein [Sterolibacteriaceae bacterium]|nr:patatin-like phospholipase family protein [Sterolibacteriaceae bacterium]
MEIRKVAIACQGGGIHGAFTCGVLTTLLRAKEDEVRGKRPDGAMRSFDIIGLSGTSAGALNAFMVWYGLMAKDGHPGSWTEARCAVNNLWDTFQVQKTGEAGMNALAQQFFKLQELGVIVKQPMPAYFYDWQMSALSQWSSMENLIAPTLNLGEIRPEFYDFAALLRTCAPEFPHIQARLDQIARDKVKPRLLLGAVEVLSGTFDAFDSWCNPNTRPQDKRTISYDAVAASGTLPDVRRSQRIPGLMNIDGKDALYWDGLFSQNPPVREFAAGTDREHTPDEIWVIRINPQKRDEEPLSLGMIEDRRNELAGNLSLNQELRFIRTVNKWLDQLQPRTKNKPGDSALAAFADYKPIKIYVITMHKDKAGLGVGSKFDRSPAFVTGMRQHGEMRAASFLPLWLSESPHLVEWPQGDALDQIDRG